MKSSMRLFGATLLIAVSSVVPRQSVQAAAPGSLVGVKVAVVVIQEAMLGQGWSRFNMAMTYARQFKQEGADVQLLFDGAGIQWLTVADLKPLQPPAAAPAVVVDTAAPIMQSSPPPEPWKADKSLVDKVEKVLAEMSALGVPIRVSGRSADRQGLREKLRRKSVTFVNEPGGVEEAPRLLAQGYQFIVF